MYGGFGIITKSVLRRAFYGDIILRGDNGMGRVVQYVMCSRLSQVYQNKYLT